MNNRTCATDYSEVLLLASRGDLRLISFDTPDLSDVEIRLDDVDQDGDDGGSYNNNISVMTIDYDPVEGFVYWTDQFRGIHRATLKGERHSKFIKEGVRVFLLA